MYFWLFRIGSTSMACTWCGAWACGAAEIRRQSVSSLARNTALGISWEREVGKGDARRRGEVKTFWGVDPIAEFWLGQAVQSDFSGSSSLAAYVRTCQNYCDRGWLIGRVRFSLRRFQP